ncbi:hypothetical protein [Asticcacaulis sp.]|uniref:hypothetical protein n=1 Tax=Asticcacaulis sp. TaxID=1872648 RepID=UPI003F7C0133
MKKPHPRQAGPVEYAREVGGVDCELTVTCRKPDAVPPEKTFKTSEGRSDRTPCALTPEQEYICDHATD